MAFLSGILEWNEARYIKVSVYTRHYKLNLGNSESFCRIILLILVIFELRYKKLILLMQNPKLLISCAGL